eukprot:6210618-Pleurochrysis_carterae.AAC.2
MVHFGGLNRAYSCLGAAAVAIRAANSASVGNGPYNRSRSRLICENGLREVVSRVCNGGSVRPTLLSSVSRTVASPKRSRLNGLVPVLGPSDRS